MFGSSEEQNVPKKRVARRVVSAPRVARKVVSTRAATAKRVVEVVAESADKSEEQREEPAEVVAEKRKAPTPLSAEEALRAQKRKQRIVIFILLSLGVGSSAVVGFLDEGQIDVEKTIEARNNRIRNNQANAEDVINSTIEIPVQDTDTQGKVDGGLIGRGTGARSPEPVVSATSTATSTDQTASSTEVVASTTEDGTAENEATEVVESSTTVPQAESTEPAVTE